MMKRFTFAFNLFKTPVPDRAMQWGYEGTKKDKETEPFFRAEVLQDLLKERAYPQRCSFDEKACIRRVVVTTEHASMVKWLDKLGTKYPEFLESVEDIT
jgi:hypothetical protein